MMNFTAGADPEMFLKKNGDYVAVQPYVDGTKYEPQPLKRGGNVQRDNVAIEFGIAPASSKLEFIQNIGDTLGDLMDMLPDDIDIDISPSAHFSQDQLEHPECKEFGCDPDFNAWKDGRLNEMEENAAAGTLRSAGGHFHFGFDGLDNLIVIKLMDLIVGLMSTVIDSSAEAIERRNLYGKPGCFRPTNYGVEYRTLSNFWIKSPLLTELVYSAASDVVTIATEGENVGIINYIGADRIQSIISEGKKEEADELLNTVVYKVLSDETMDLYNRCKELKDINFKDAWGL